MTDQDIIKLAMKAKYYKGVATHDLPQLRKFLELVSAHEREECAKVADEFRKGAGDPVCAQVADGIRARSCL